MVRIRLRRIGAKKKPSYRIVVIDSHAPRNGAYLEMIGHYDPMTEPAAIQIDPEKAKQWIQKGAQPSERVAKLMTKIGILPLAQG
ncbi:MAG: 30S ribosomal protein S16 [Dehalococcoidia bacterium]|nr:30S ribosomal protein S16 [Dehalococcoidia bacterium]